MILWSLNFDLSGPWSAQSLILKRAEINVSKYKQMDGTKCENTGINGF